MTEQEAEDRTDEAIRQDELFTRLWKFLHDSGYKDNLLHLALMGERCGTDHNKLLYRLITAYSRLAAKQQADLIKYAHEFGVPGSKLVENSTTTDGEGRSLSK